MKQIFTLHRRKTSTTRWWRSSTVSCRRPKQRCTRRARTACACRWSWTRASLRSSNSNRKSCCRTQTQPPSTAGPTSRCPQVSRILQQCDAVFEEFWRGGRQMRNFCNLSWNPCFILASLVNLNPIDPTDFTPNMRYYPRLPQTFDQISKFKVLPMNTYLLKRDNSFCLGKSISRPLL